MNRLADCFAVLATCIMLRPTRKVGWLPNALRPTIKVGWLPNLDAASNQKSRLAPRQGSTQQKLCFTYVSQFLKKNIFAFFDPKNSITPAGVTPIGKNQKKIFFDFLLFFRELIHSDAKNRKKKF